MRKVLFLTVIALLSVGTLSAQSRALRDAQRALRSNDLNEARTLARQAAEHPDTANDPALWKLKGDIGNAAFDAQLTRLMLGQDANERVMFDGLFESFAPYVKADSLGQLPDARGRVNNRVRRDIQSILRANHMHFINGGIFFNEQRNFARAADFFEIFWNIPFLPMFEGANMFELDETFQTMKFYAVITALQAEQYPRAIVMMNRILNEPFIENSEFTESDIFELLASTYQQLGDSVRFLETIRTGAARFPDNEFLVLNYLHELITDGQYNRAIEYIDRTVAANSALACNLISVKGALLAEQGDLEAADREFRRALSIDPYCENALEHLARSYIVRVQDLRDGAWNLPRAEQLENNRLALEGYQAALPLLETLDEVLQGRSAPQHEQTGVLLLLRNVYFNLSTLGVDKSAQLEAVERRLPEEFR